MKQRLLLLFLLVCSIGIYAAEVNGVRITTSEKDASGKEITYDFLFKSNPKLTYLNSYDGTTLTSIGRYAFSYNVNATFLELPETLSSVDDHAFENCRSLTEITCDAVTPPSCGGGEVFGSVNWKNCKLIVPEGSIDAYKSAFVWKNFFNIESDINETKNESTVVKDSYSVSGQRTTGNYRGLTIQRTNDGQTRKVIVR